MVRYVAVLLLLLTTGCASATLSQPQVAATQPATPEPAASEPAATPVAAAPPQPAAAPPVASEPAATPVAPPTPQPAPAAAAPQSVKAPAPQAARKNAAPVARTPAPVASPKPAALPVAASGAVTAAPTLNLDALKEQLRATKAIGVFTKISLKNKVDDLMKQFRDHYQSKTKPTLAELRQSYDLLMMKVLSLLQDGDQKLAAAVVSSREAIWALLADEKKFAALQTE
jgi:outer membrane biosynthesis protein TonB